MNSGINEMAGPMGGPIGQLPGEQTCMGCQGVKGIIINMVLENSGFHQ